ASREAAQALLAEMGGAVGCRGAGEERERDGRVDVGEDGDGAGPEALQQGAELVGEGDALGDQVVSRANERAQRSDLVRERLQTPEAMPVGAQQIGEDEGIAGVALALRGGVTRPRGLER